MKPAIGKTVEIDRLQGELMLSSPVEGITHHPYPIRLEHWRGKLGMENMFLSTAGACLSYK